MKKIGVYPGSFDPVTLGHLDIIERAVPLFDRLIVACGENLSKKPFFNARQRVEMLKQVTASFPRVEVDSFSTLLAHYVKEKKATTIVRGLRAVSDFEHEFQAAIINRKLAPEVETIFLMTKEEHLYLSSSIVKEIALLGGCIKGLVPEIIEEKLVERFEKSLHSLR
ncbi:pantetheine-phosphate adenylyltransferase [bacterium]|nr:pantetheine-phosphate adenylyltransferase [bacterium]MBU1614749.1 pantetheine-phosphate adenylyltransferase [bacterium]